MTATASQEALLAPPERWERALAGCRRWCTRHDSLLRVVRRVVWVATALALVVGLVAVLVVPKFGNALVPALFMMLDLGVLVFLARTRTIAWRTAAATLGAGVWWGFGVAGLTVLVASASRLDVYDDGMQVSLAAFVEEPGKLALLLLVAVLAPGRVRRFAATDWALLGFAAGAGFQVAEDGVRRLREVKGLGLLVDNGDLPYSLNPWASGEFTSLDGSAVMPGHQVWTASIAMGIGLGILLWRTGRPAGRVSAWLLPLALFAVAVSDHASYNALAGLSGWPDVGGYGFPGWMWLLWTMDGRGRLAIPLSIGLFMVCLAVDSQRRVHAGWFGVTVPDAPEAWQPTLTGWPAALRTPVLAACGFLSLAVSDLAIGLAAYQRHGGSRVAAMLAGREASVFVRAARADAMTVTTPGNEPASRRRFRWWALLIGAVGLAACLLYGSLVAQAIGHWLRMPEGQPFFAGTLSALGQWWNSIGPVGQIVPRPPSSP